MTRRSFAQLVAALSTAIQSDGPSESEVRLLCVHDLSDFARRFTLSHRSFRPARLFVRAHLDFWPGAGDPRRWELRLEDASGLKVLRVLADPAHRAIGEGAVSPAAHALCCRIRLHWLSL